MKQIRGESLGSQSRTGLPLIAQSLHVHVGDRSVVGVLLAPWGGGRRGSAPPEGGAAFENIADEDAVGAGQVPVRHLEQVLVPRQEVHQERLAAPRRACSFDCVFEKKEYEYRQSRVMLLHCVDKQHSFMLTEHRE